MSAPNKGAFRKGEKRPKQGRPPGTPNKTTQQLKDMILGALEEKGGVMYLAGLADSHPPAFAALLAKVLPMQVTGANGGPMVFERIVREIVEPKK